MLCPVLSAWGRKSTLWVFVFGAKVADLFFLSSLFIGPLPEEATRNQSHFGEIRVLYKT